MHSICRRTAFRIIKRSFCLLPILFFLFVFLPAFTVQAQGGIAVSGSFSRHHYKMLPGESIDTPHINVVFFNNYSQDITVKLTPRLPEGAKFHLESDELLIKANSNVTIPMGLTVGLTVTPDDYDIGLAADVQPDAETGIAVVGSAELRTKLSVYGEAGRVKIDTLTVTGDPIRATLNLSRKEGNSLSPAGYSNTGQLEECLIPGAYVVVAYWEGVEIASEQFELAADEEKELTLVAQTVFINAFTATPQYAETGGKIASARLTYTINNIYLPLSDARLVLNVFHRGRQVDQLEMFTLPVLELGSQDHRYSYIPPEGWQSGEYKFRIDLYAEENILFATSRDQFIDLGGFYFDMETALGVGGGLLIFIIYILWKRRRKCPECKGDEVIECAICKGSGYLLSGGKKYHCQNCGGEGVVSCPECKDN